MIDDVTMHATLTSYSLTPINVYLLLGSRVYKKQQTSAIIWEIPDINLEAGRYGSKSGVSRIIRES